MRLGMAGAMLLAGCSAATRPATLQQLQHRAVFDLGCAPQQLQLVSVDERTKAVGGCGRWLVYVHQCEAMGQEESCGWLVNGPAQPPQAPCGATVPSAPAPALPPDLLLRDRH